MKKSNVVYLFNPNTPQSIMSADSFAYQEIVLNQMSFPAFHKQYNKGNIKEQMEFGSQYANSCAKYIVELLLDSKNPQADLPILITQFSCAVIDLHDIEFAEGLYTLRNIIIEKLPQFCEINGSFVEIKPSILHIIALTVLEEIYFNQENYPLVLNILNQYYSSIT